MIVCKLIIIKYVILKVIIFFIASHSCFVWCQKRGGGYMTQGWKLPDGTPCGKEKVNFNNKFCYNGECKLFDCDGLNTDGNNDEICSSSSSEL